MSKDKEQAAAPLIGEKGSNLKGLLAHNDIVFALGLAVVLATLLIPLPTFLLDMLLSCSIAVSIATLIIVLSARESIELSTFPSLLLFVTLFRLSLNVASTRLILLQGDAGQIINTFGHTVVGGNLVIGLVVFLILVIIQFVVITKGAERISEVAARFNLDAMPGKQMAIDADLNAGMIGEDQARERRKKVSQESEFYGAMDGASKFVRGDAIAGLIITAVNLIGGFVVGMMHGMSAGKSVETYGILAIGDGLVTQIPAVVISTASGFLISKTATKSNLSTDLIRQMFARGRPLGIAAFLFGAMVFIPGFPKIPFVVLAIGTALLSRSLLRQEKEDVKSHEKPKAKTSTDDFPVEELLDVDRVCVQVGPRLIKIVDPRLKNSLSQRIAPLRRKFAQQYGVILPLVRLRDNVSLDGDEYEIRLNNHVVASGRLEPEMFLAMDPGTVTEEVKGRSTVEPVFQLPAMWIGADTKDQAELAGYTVVDPESVLVTHLSETLRRHLYELLSRDDVQQLVDRLRNRQPSLVNGVIGEVVPIGLLQRVLQNLLRDSLPIRDLAQIIETLADNVPHTRDPGRLTEFARKALIRTVTESAMDASGKIKAIVLDPALEHELLSASSQNESEGLVIPPDKAIDFSRRVAEAWRSAMDSGCDSVVLLCDFKLRGHLANMLARQIPDLSVIAYDEIAIGTEIESVETVSLQDQPGAIVGV